MGRAAEVAPKSLRGLLVKKKNKTCWKVAPLWPIAGKSEKKKRGAVEVGDAFT